MSHAALEASLDVAPIRHAFPPTRRALPFGASLALMVGVLFTLARFSFEALRAEGPVLDLRVYRSVGVPLREAAAPPAAHPGPVSGPGHGKGEPGLGHVLGTGTLDPKLLDVPTVRRSQDLAPSDVPSPERLLVAPGSPGPMADKSLPLAPGGNGLAKGTGLDAGRGGGGGSIPARIPDFKLVVLHREEAVSDLPDTDPELRMPVQVKLLIGEDGVPAQVEFLSGPARLSADCLTAARKWRFEPLRPHGLRAPYALVLTFHPRSRR